MSMPPPGHPAHPGMSAIYGPGALGPSLPPGPPDPRFQAARSEVEGEKGALLRSLADCATGQSFAGFLWGEAPNGVLTELRYRTAFAHAGVDKALGLIRKRRFAESARFDLAARQTKNGDGSFTYAEDCLLLGSKGHLLRARCAKPLDYRPGWRVVAEWDPADAVPGELAKPIRSELKHSVWSWANREAQRRADTR